MQFPTSAQVLFELVDGLYIEYRANRLKDSIFAEYRDFPWTHAQRKTLETLLRRELESLVTDILGMFDDEEFIMPSASVPDGPVGFTIHSVHLAEDNEGIDIGYAGGTVKEGPDIRAGNTPYAIMWSEYLRQKAGPDS